MTWRNTPGDLHMSSKTPEPLVFHDVCARQALSKPAEADRQQPRNKRMITISPLHTGLRGLGHAGIAAGRFAELVDPKRAMVRTHAPIPVRQRLEPVLNGDGSVDVFCGSTRIATSRRLKTPLAVATFPSVHPGAAAEAQCRSFAAPGGDHPSPTCYVCGNQRTDGQGLRLRPGPLSGGTVFAATWTPDVVGPVPAWLVWAALDCPSFAPARAAAGRDCEITPCSLAVEIRGDVVGGLEHQILSRTTHVGPRKTVAESELVAPDGSSLAVASASWTKPPCRTGSPPDVTGAVVMARSALWP